MILIYVIGLTVAIMKLPTWAAKCFLSVQLFLRNLRLFDLSRWVRIWMERMNWKCLKFTVFKQSLTHNKLEMSVVLNVNEVSCATEIPFVYWTLNQRCQWRQGQTGSNVLKLEYLMYLLLVWTTEEQAAVKVAAHVTFPLSQLLWSMFHWKIPDLIVALNLCTLEKIVDVDKKWLSEGNFCWFWVGCDCSEHKRDMCLFHWKCYCQTVLKSHFLHSCTL